MNIKSHPAYVAINAVAMARPPGRPGADQGRWESTMFGYDWEWLRTRPLRQFVLLHLWLSTSIFLAVKGFFIVFGSGRLLSLWFYVIWVVVITPVNMWLNKTVKPKTRR
jgi:hypothetical protein